MTDPIAFFASGDATPRHALPLLSAAQAQKELHHNEALARLDFMIMPVVEGTAFDPELLSPEPAPLAGQAWIVGTGAYGIFATHVDRIACWTEAGWRFLEPLSGTRVFDRSANCSRCFGEVGWSSIIAPAAPTGGTTVDEQARDAIGEILELLRQFTLAPAL